MTSWLSEVAEQLCVPFVTNNRLAHQFVTDGSRYARACYTGPRTAIHIEEALVAKVKTMPVLIIENCMAAELIIRGGTVLADEKDKKQLSRDDATYSYYFVLKKKDNLWLVKKREPVRPASVDLLL